MRALAIGATLTALCLLTIEAMTVDEGVTFAQSGSHGHAKGVYDDTDGELDNEPQPSAKDDKNAPTAYEVDVAVDKEGDAEEDEQEQEDEGVAFVQSRSRAHAKLGYDDTDDEADNEEGDGLVDKEGDAEEDDNNAPRTYEVDGLGNRKVTGFVDMEGDAEEDDTRPLEPHELDGRKEGDAEEDEQEQEDEGVAFVQSGSHLRGSSKADPIEEDSAKTRKLEALQPVLDRLKGLDGKAYGSLSNMIAQATMQH